MKNIIKKLFTPPTTDYEKAEETTINEEEKQEKTIPDKIETLKNNAEEILSIIPFDWKKQTLENDVIEPMIALLEEQQRIIKELEFKLSLSNKV